MAWGYFGISDIALVAEPGPLLLVSSATSPAGELCLVAEGPGVGAAPCLEAIAKGTAAEVFSFNEESQLVSAATKLCVARAGGDAAAMGKVVLQDCAEAIEAGDGRSAFELSGDGKLRFKSLGDYCLSASTAGATAVDCSMGKGFFAAAVGDVDPAAAALVKDTADLLIASARRQSGLLADLQKLLPLLDSCRVALPAVNVTVQRPLALVAGASVGHGSAEPALESMGQVYMAMGVDMGFIRSLLAESAGALSSAVAKAQRRA